MQLTENIDKLDNFLDIYKKNETLHASNIESIAKLKGYLKEFECDIRSGTYKSNSPYQEAIKNIKKALINELNQYSFGDNFAVSINGYKSVDLNLSDINWPDIKQINEDFKRIQLLKVVKDIEYSIVLLGANGSGKSSFANFLKGTAISNVCVLPAQKILQINVNGSYDYRANVEKVRMRQGESFAKGNIDLYYSGSDFTHLITALSSDELQLIVDEREQRITKEEYIKKSHFSKLTEIFYQLIPSIKLRIDSHNRLFIPSKHESDYAFEHLSDGEKALLYYIGNILLASQKSFIIIDEPETYINPSIYKKLWDILIKERPDCQFIFITHSMDFIASRNPEQTKFFWIKNFIPPEHWDIEALPVLDHLPKSLIAELAASKKNIIFCEGGLSSLDYRVYSILFGKNYTIQPVGGHISVISYTRAINSSNRLGSIKAIGIIDSDMISEEGKQEYNKENIYVLSINEIEMFLIDEFIILAVLQKFHNPQEVEKKIAEFKKQYFLLIRDNLTDIITAIIKKEIDKELENYRLQEGKSIEKIKSELESLKDKLPNIDHIFESNKEKISSLLDKQEYNELLKFCNLKGAIIPGLTNKYIESDYIKKAIHCLEEDIDLQTKLVGKYFLGLSKND